MSDAKRACPIAVIGISSLFPGSKDVDGFWRDIVEGRDRLGPVPRTHWLIEDYYDPDPKAPDKIYVDRGGFIDPIAFDPMKWGVPPATLPSTDTTQLLSLLVAERALSDAFGSEWESSGIDRDRVGVMLGVTSAQKLLGEMNSRLQRPVWARALREMGLSEEDVEEACDRISASYVPWQETTFPGVLGNVVAGRIANRLDLGGTNCVTDAACASAFGALHMAVNELALGHADVTICGGADTMNDPFMFECFAKTTALSKKGDCTPFDATADGTMLGEGIAIVVLARLEDAERRGDRVYAVIRGVGTSSDGRAKSVYAPLPSGQAKALRRAYERAGYGPETVELVEAHGTGTAAGDAAEVSALLEVFAGAGACALGSVKAQIGHTKAAAGAAGLIKTVLALRHGVIPPTIKVKEPAAALKDGPFYLPAKARPWIRGGDHPRRASVSSFGFGGSNYHLTLEEYTGEHKAPRLPVDGAELVVLSASDGHGLLAAARAIEGPLRWAAWSSQRTFDPALPARLAIVAESDEDLRGKLEVATGAIERGESVSMPGGIEVAFGAGNEPLAILFPGQGSQYLEMGAALAMRFEAAREVWDRAGDLHRVVFAPHTFDEKERAEQAEKLTRTENAQPALGAASAAMWAVLRALGIDARAFAGHSFGEVVALYAAGAFGERELFEIAKKRGELMSSGEGTMLAVSAPIDVVRSIAGELSIANHNGPSQVVLSGTRDAIDAAEARCKEKKLRTARLEVSAAFHSPLVAGSKAPFEAFLSTLEIAAPRAPVYSNATARPYEEVRATLASQIAEPVRFVEEIEAMYAAGIRTFVEVGAGSVLSGLVERILSGKPHRAIAMDRKGSPGLRAFYAGLARMCAAGVPMRFDVLWDGERAPVDPKSIVQPKMTVDVSGANLGKPYPPRGDSPVRPSPPRKAAVSPPLTPPAAREGDAARAADSPDALRAFLEMQRQTAEAHSAYQRAVADAHAAFLRSSEAAMTAIAALAGGAPVTLPMPVPMELAPVKVELAPPVVAAPSIDLASLMMSVVAEKTGYPAEMLAPSMELEADLGVDSIKRVEILAALRERAPHLAEIDPAVLGKLRTLAEIAELLGSAIESPPPAAPASREGSPLGDIVSLMMGVVAEKTGYPAEMLAPSMELEADLGVDSIKRVEILAALRERAPHLAEIDPAVLGKLRTLAEIAELLGGAIEPSAPAAPSGDLVSLMMGVVAEKTGYPAEMLAPSMELEADLGVDSIKRVEILAALRERAPGLPEIDPAELGKLRTLDQIAAVLTKQRAPSNGKAPPRKAPSHALERSTVHLIEAEAPGLAPPGLFDARSIAVTDDGRIAERLARRLIAEGLPARVVKSVPADADAVIVLAALRDPREHLSANREALDAARAIAKRFSEHGGTFIAVQDTGGWLGLRASDRAWLASATGLAKTAAIEWPRASVRAIDLASDDPELAADRLAAEILDGGNAREVGIDARGVRRVPVLSSAPAPIEAPMKPPVVVASGGARGVTASCLVALAERWKGKYLLLGRTPLLDEPAGLASVSNAELKRALMKNGKAPREVEREASALVASREVKETLRALGAAGAEARYAAVDVADGAALARVLEEARGSFGPFTMIVHGAGVLADRLIADKRDEDFDRVFGPKVAGLEALLGATERDPIDTMLFFSSVAARFGNAGQADYAMANSVLDAVAAQEAQKRPHARVRSLAWGPWRGGMVGDGLAKVFESRGIALIDVAQGAEAFAREAASGGASTLVLGAGLAPSAEVEHRFTVRVNERTHAYLNDHVVKDVPVVPVVLVLDWIARAARSLRPHLAVARVREVSVLRGLPVRSIGDGERYELALRLVSNGHGATYRAELRDARGPCYRAEVDLVPELPSGAAVRPPPVGLEARVQPIYGGCLFHGERFRVIEQLEGVGDAGAAGILVGTTAVGWNGAGWQTDPALLDGGLQLAVLWSERRLGGAALPTGLGALHLYREGPIEGRARTIAHGRAAASGKAVCDVVFLDDEGRPIAELRGVETHVRPGTSAAELR